LGRFHSFLVRLADEETLPVFLMLLSMEPEYHLAEQLGISVRTVYGFLKALKEDAMAESR